SPKFIHHSAEAILTQEVYQLLAGYPDHNDAQELRDDPLFQILADVAPDAERPLASGSTLARFQYAYTRRDAELPPEERPVPLAAWLRPGTAPASLGAVDILDRIVTALRAAWPGVRIRVRSDNGLAVPGLSDYCEDHGLTYALGYATNAVLQRATAQALADL